VPDWLEPDAAEAFARDLIERLGEGSLRPAGGDGRERTAREELARLACRVQQEDRAAADADEAARVVEALLSCDQPLVDPQGRPTFFELSHREVLRRLGRA
jgi:DNA mismatch repair ATPase MutL